MPMPTALPVSLRRLVQPVSWQSLWRAVWRGPGKRVFDLLVVALAAPLWAPVLIGLVGLLAVSGGTPFHAQYRVGRNGRLFRMWKLRSMRRGAEGQLALLLAHPARRAEWLAHGKLARDPRVTRLGRWMRRHSLDELPQVWNVIRGDMALVGPRPLLPDEIAREYGAAAQQVLALRPGMTGPWQVAGRNRLRYAERLRMDLAYVNAPGVAQDVAILSRTCAAILRGTGT